MLLDVVVNHKMGADEKERIRVQRVNQDDRTQIDDNIIECEGWTRYTFPARAGQYSNFIWDYHCFSGIDHIENPDEDGIFKIVNDYTGDGWNDQVDDEMGNFDYLMGKISIFAITRLRKRLNIGLVGSWNKPTVTAFARTR